MGIGGEGEGRAFMLVYLMVFQQNPHKDPEGKYSFSGKPPA